MQTALPISRQVVLPWRQTIQIAWQNIRLRLGRSLLVTSGIVLAITFLVSIQTHETIIAGLRNWIANAPANDRAKASQLEATLHTKGIATTRDEIAKERLQSRWLIGLALLVALVGVLNAMLMSVTERFREIGTMKCLGALDGFVVKLFLIESLVHGIVGSLVGATLGAIVSIVSASVTYGVIVWHESSIRHLAADAASALVIGTALAMLGAIYPACQAARMHPVEAMRSEI
jgi:predicted lysophospholipase L1 biosynthesis ABC-type transport system permease subunit